MFRNAQTTNTPSALGSERTAEKQSWPSPRPLQSSATTSMNFCPFIKSAVRFWKMLRVNQETCQSQSDAVVVLQFCHVLLSYIWFCPLPLNVSIMVDVESGVICAVNPPKVLLTTCQRTQSRLKNNFTHGFRRGIKLSDQFVSVKRTEHVEIGSSRRSCCWINQTWGLHG